MKPLQSYPLMALMLGQLFTVSCKSSTKEPTPDDLQAGYLTGRAVNSLGKPLKGVQVIADNTLFYNSNLLTATDEKGSYKIQLPPAAGTYRATAEIKVNYNGQRYKLNLRPDNTDAFSERGGVRNFVWTLSGEDPDESGRYYGGEITLDKDLGSQLYDVENIVFTLVPVGPLIDGSTGQTLKLRSGEPRSTTYGILADVPIGRYKISAVHQPTGTPVRVRKKNGTFSTDGTATLDFYGENSPWACTNCMILEYGE